MTTGETVAEYNGREWTFNPEYGHWIIGDGMMAEVASPMLHDLLDAKSRAASLSEENGELREVLRGLVKECRVSFDHEDCNVMSEGTNGMRVSYFFHPLGKLWRDAANGTSGFLLHEPLAGCRPQLVGPHGSSGRRRLRGGWC